MKKTNSKTTTTQQNNKHNKIANTFLSQSQLPHFKSKASQVKSQKQQIQQHTHAHI